MSSAKYRLLWNLKKQLVYAARGQKANKTVVIFEGSNCTYRSSTSRTIVEHLPTKSVKLVALGMPTQREETQLFGAQRFINSLPAVGDIVFFDRSYYSRANVEKIMGFVTNEEAGEFLQNVSLIELLMKNSGVNIIKYWIDVCPKIQKKRIEERMSNPLKKRKLNPIDIAVQEKHKEYIDAMEKTFSFSHKKYAPWYVINGNNKLNTKINCINHLIGVLNNGHSTFKPYNSIDDLRIIELIKNRSS